MVARATADELRTRRIGRNELDVIQVMLALTDAQQDYRDQDGGRQYAQRILRAQGQDAAGGAYSYVAGGRMTKGCAFVAWPAKWGDTGVMTFVVAADGVVWQKELGPRTDALARAMTTYNPDASWTRARPAR
ncbi:MAG: DUF2950 family protein [Burkholderiales bacterium]